MVSHNTDIATRALVVSLKSPCYGKSTAEVVTITGLSKSTVNKIYARAVARGFNPDKQPIIIRDCYLEDAPHKGRPTKLTEETKEAVLAKLRCDQHEREKTCADISRELSSEGIHISSSSVHRVFKAAGIKKPNRRRKPVISETLE